MPSLHADSTQQSLIVDLVGLTLPKVFVLSPFAQTTSAFLEGSHPLQSLTTKTKLDRLYKKMYFYDLGLRPFVGMSHWFE